MCVSVHRRIAEMRKREDYEETETDAVRITAIEDEDKWHQELNTISPASRITGLFARVDTEHTLRTEHPMFKLLSTGTPGWDMTHSKHLSDASF